MDCPQLSTLSTVALMWGDPDFDDGDRWCDCDCHNYWHPDGLLCNDGYCDVCSAEAGGYPGDPHPADYDAKENRL